MPGIIISRRAFLSGTTALGAISLLPRRAYTENARVKGGRLVVAADSEPRNLNPAIVASNGVFFVASKVIEPLAEASYDGENGLAPRLAVAWEGSSDGLDRKSTRLNSSHVKISYAVFCLKKKKR